MSTGHGDAFVEGAAYPLETVVYIAALLLLSGALPFVVGLLAGRFAAWWRESAAGFSVGVVALLFIDYVKEAADLGQATGAAGTIALLVGAFAVGALAAGFFAGRARKMGGAALAWAIAIALHGLGEGLLVSSDVASGTFVMSLTQGASFGIHKGLEGLALGVLVAAAVGTRAWGRLASIALVPLLAAPFFARISPAILPSVAFAAGAGAALLALAALGAHAAPGGRVRLGVACAVLAGALAVYLAGLLHQF